MHLKWVAEPAGLQGCQTYGPRGQIRPTRRLNPARLINLESTNNNVWKKVTVLPCFHAKNIKKRTLDKSSYLVKQNCIADVPPEPLSRRKWVWHPCFKGKLRRLQTFSSLLNPHVIISLPLAAGIRKDIRRLIWTQLNKKAYNYVLLRDIVSSRSAAPRRGLGVSLWNALWSGIQYQGAFTVVADL